MCVVLIRYTLCREGPAAKRPMPSASPQAWTSSDDANSMHPNLKKYNSGKSGEVRGATMGGSSNPPTPPMSDLRRVISGSSALPEATTLSKAAGWTTLHMQAADNGLHRVSGSILTPPSESNHDGLDRVISNMNARGPDGITPLMLAACNSNQYQDMPTQRMLIPGQQAAGRNLEQNVIFSNPMVAARGGYYGQAVSTKKESFLWQLLSLGADHSLKSFSAEETALHMASRSGLEENVRILLQAGADPNSGDNIGATPLHAAVAVGSIPVVQVSFKANGSYDKTNSHCCWEQH